MEMGSIGSAIRAGRRQKGWSQEQLGKAVGLPQSHIAKVEAGADIQVSTLSKLAHALGLHIQLTPSLRESFLHPAPSSRIAAARDYGVDLGQLYASIRKSPSERLQSAVESARGLAELKAALRT